MDSSSFTLFGPNPVRQQYADFDPNGGFEQNAIDFTFPHSLHSQHATTSMAQQEENTRRTRSGRPLGGEHRSDSPHESSTTSRRKRNTSPKRKKPRNNVVKQDLAAPLSVLTKDITSVPIRDMEAWVKRPLEERQEEARQRKGYVTRPMNSFMLYRSAYAERTKAWCKENNHQIVSSVSGQSWPLEPPEIREFYNDLAKLERINHQRAHPDYKFSPAKPKSDKRKAEEEEDSDADWGASHTVRRRHKEGRDASYPARSAPVLPIDDDRSYIHANDWSYPRGGWPQAQHQADRAFLDFAPRANNGPYYGQEIRDVYANPQHEMLRQREILLQQHRNTERLIQQYHNDQLLQIGLPGNTYNDLSQLRSNATTPAGSLDPDLGTTYGVHHSIISSQPVQPQRVYTPELAYANTRGLVPTPPLAEPVKQSTLLPHSSQQRQRIQGYPPPRHVVQPAVDDDEEQEDIQAVHHENTHTDNWQLPAFETHDEFYRELSETGDSLYGEHESEQELDGFAAEDVAPINDEDKRQVSNPQEEHAAQEEFTAVAPHYDDLFGEDSDGNVESLPFTDEV